MRNPCIPLITLFLAVSAVQARSQSIELSWQLPPYAFLEYRRQMSSNAPASFGSDAAPGVYSHEIHRGREVQYVRGTLLELVPQVCLSLPGTKSPQPKFKRHAKFAFDNVLVFGKIRAKGTVVTEDVADPKRIRQTAVFELTDENSPKPPKAAPEGAGGEPKKRRPTANVKLYLSGCTLEFTRWIDAIDGRVTAFDATLEGSFFGPGQPVKKFRHTENWKLEKIWEPDSRDFRKRVNDAIRRGEEFLEKSNPSGIGPVALTALTLLKSNPDRDRPAVARLLELVRQAQPDRTYELAVCIQALEAYYEPANETEQLRSGLITEPAERHLSESDMRLVEAWTKRLLANRSKSGGNRWRFHYTPDGGYDNSNTQFAALGLQSAERCGVEIPKAVWEGLAWHFSRDQLDGDKKDAVRMTLIGYKKLAEMKRRSAGGTYSSSRGSKVMPRGFNYHKPDETRAGRRISARAPKIQPAYGSMTCAGVTGLTIAQSGLAKRRRRDSKLLGRLEVGRREGFAWLYANYDVRRNPNKEQSWYYYYLYSLERTCELSGIALLHDHNWYFDGAMQLVTSQKRNGGWNGGRRGRGAVIDTCFAILFLKRAIAPVVTR